MGKRELLNELEEKTFPFEIKELEDSGTFTGYAAIFGKSDLLGEVIERGAFTKTLKESKTRPMLWYHNPTEPLGIATLRTDDKGLYVEGQLNLEVQAAKEKYALMKQKVIRGLSIGFRTVVDLWKEKMRIIKEVKLYEISPCTFQAHPAALISAVKQAGLLPELKLHEGINEFLNEYKSGKMVSAANLKLLNNAVEALAAILKKLEPSDDTQANKKSMFFSVIERLETESKPQEHLFGSTIKTLKNIKLEV